MSPSTRRTSRIGQPAWLLAAVLLIGSVAAGAVGEPLPELPDPLRAHQEALKADDGRNRVLLLERLALDALRQGREELAARVLDEVLTRIEGFYVDSERAAQARSVWYEEGSKDFLGEPYERAMAYLYRGLLHMRRGEWDDARACFKSGMLQDAFAEEEQHRCDFAVLAYLYGHCCRALGDEIGLEDAFQEARSLMPRLKLPIRRSSRHLVLVESGGAPRKVADGLGHGQLKYFRGRGFQETAVQLRRGSSLRDADIFEDLYWQASTRGGRSVDKIIEGKVIFQTQTAQAGRRTARAGEAVQVAGVVADSGQAVGIGGTLSLIGGVAQLIAARARPHADIRYWDNLPDQIFLFELPPSAATKPYRLVYLDDQGRAIEEYCRPLEVEADCGQPICVTFIPSPTYPRGEADP